VNEVAAAQLVASSLQLAATHRASTPPALLSSAAAAAAGGAAATPLLRLQSFSINYLVTPSLLYALPAASLTRLELHFFSSPQTEQQHLQMAAIQLHFHGLQTCSTWS
jgi:hypothetical protein